MAYWKAFDFTSRLMPIKEDKKIFRIRKKRITNEKKNRELAFENEEGCVWKIIKPVFTTASCLKTHTPTHTVYMCIYSH